MDKVGLVIQFENVDNYGTVLQALATERMVEQLGYAPRLIRYRKKYTPKFILSQIPRAFEKSNWLPLLRRLRMRQGSTESKTFVDYQNAKKAAFSAFRSERFPENMVDTYWGYEALREGSEQYDTVLVGSDQLWLPQGVKSNYYNLMFVNDKVNKVSYATSFGVSVIPKKQEKEYRRYLDRIDFLSVREASGCEIIKRLTDREAYLACDPVMLLEPCQWKEIAETADLPENIQPGKYIFSYFLGVDENARREARKLADAMGLELVSLVHLEDYCRLDDEPEAGITPRGVRPELFVKLIQNATGIITDSFHGTAFSIIFEKQFVTTYRWNHSVYSKNTRIDNILGRFGLESRLYAGKDIVSQMTEAINYDKVSKEREKWRKTSAQYLETALKR